MSLEVIQIPCLKDNYGYLIHDAVTGLTASVDTPDPDAILDQLKNRGWRLTHIFNTHHHWDHAGGNLDLKAKTGCRVVGAEIDQQRIPGIDHCVREGEQVLFGDHRFIVHETPGHTLGHIAYHFIDQHLAFVGDTLFSLGCGRLFEGSPDQMWTSLRKMMQWPDQTLIYCAHEYTEANARFAMTIEPDNPDLQKRYEDVKRLREEGRATIPTTIALEKKTNPFLRADSLSIQSRLNMKGAPLKEVFARIRQLKDDF